MGLNNAVFPEVQDEGVAVASQPKINFIGASVTAANDATNGRVNVTISGVGGGDFMADGSVPMTADINTATHQVVALSVPDAAGEAIRQTAKITEVALEDAVDKKHTANADTDLDGTFEATFMKNALLTERGSVIYRNATVPAELLHGTAGQVLQSGGDGADPSWLTVDNTAGGTNGLAAPISSDVVYDHGVATTAVHGVGAGTVAKTADIVATKIDDLTAGDDNTDLDSNTTRHGLLLKAVAPAATLINVVGIGNGETAYTNKALLDSTAPSTQAFGDSAASGSQLLAARRDHKHAMMADPVTAHVAAANPHTVYMLKQMAENDPILLDAAISGDGYYSGICEAGVAGAALVFGNLVYFQTADSRWEKAGADNSPAGFNLKLGICVLAAAGDGSATTILLWGKVNAATLYPTFTIGAPVHLGLTAGTPQVAAPTLTTDCVRIIGYGNTGDELFFCPDSTYLELV